MADSYKNTDAPLRSGEVSRPIDIGKNNLSAILQQGRDHINFLQDSAPVRLENIFAVKTGAEADMTLAAANSARPQRSSASPTKQVPGNPSNYRRGDVVVDTERGKKVTIIQANAGVTKKGRPVHKVASGSGNSWLQMESKLERP